MPKISIILTSYNHAKFIRESIDSVLNQTMRDFELIILDDGSVDGSWEVIGQYSDPRIRAYRNETNMGSVPGVNRAIAELATGEYIAIHHSDDVWELDKLQKQIDFIAANPQVGAVFTNAQPIDERGQSLTDKSHFYYSAFNQPNRTRHEWLRHFFFRGNALCHPSVLIRRQCYEECGLYLDALAQLTDFEMWIRLCFKYEIHVLPDRLVRFRIRDAEMNTSGNRPEVRIRDRSEFHYALKHFLRIGTFDELVSIFPEVERFRRPDGCVPKFVFAMAALDEKSLQWAKLLGIETLFELMVDPIIKEKIKALYQFNYRDFTALTGKHDLFYLEMVSSQRAALVEREATIARQTRQIAELMRSPAAAARRIAAQAVAGCEQPADREAYNQAARLFEAGQAGAGKAQLELLAQNGSTCWDVYNDLGVQYFNEGDFARATASFERGLALEGDAGTTARNYASMRLAAGDVEGALATWGGILHEQPQDEAVLAVIREVLSNINPIPSSVWDRLVLDIRSGAEGAVPVSHGAIEGIARSQPAAPVKEIKVFQIYYDDKTRSQLDPAFIPLDNTENARPDWCEYWPIRKVLLNQTFDDDTYLGFFSPRFGEKTGMSGKQVLAAVRASGEEVVSFSPYFDLAAIYDNPFKQGEVNHPGLMVASLNVLNLLGVDLNLNELVCDQTTTVFSNYFVARYSFWKKWIGYVEQVIAVCEGPDSELKSSLVSSTTYRAGGEYEMKLFVLERMATVVMEELGIRSRVGIDIGKAPTLLRGSSENLVGLLICDALKGQYRKTGQAAYLDAFFKVRGGAGGR